MAVLEGPQKNGAALRLLGLARASSNDKVFQALPKGGLAANEHRDA